MAPRPRRKICFLYLSVKKLSEIQGISHNQDQDVFLPPTAVSWVMDLVKSVRTWLSGLFWQVLVLAKSLPVTSPQESWFYLAIDVLKDNRVTNKFGPKRACQCRTVIHTVSTCTAELYPSIALCPHEATGYLRLVNVLISRIIGLIGFGRFLATRMMALSTVTLTPCSWDKYVTCEVVHMAYCDGDRFGHDHTE